jgi:hypothetical protein
MEFQSERSAITMLSDVIVKSGVSLYNSIKYIYSIAEDDFYNCNIKDVLKVVLNNLTDINCLQALGLRINADKCKEMNSPEYNNVLPLIVYSFAVRIPVLKNITVNNQTLTDEQLKAIYDTVMAKGAKNYMDTIPESYDEIRKLVKSKKPIPPYTADWYKTFIYTRIPELAEIKNKNMFLLGAVDILFTMFYACLEEELENTINKIDKL